MATDFALQKSHTRQASACGTRGSQQNIELRAQASGARHGRTAGIPTSQPLPHASRFGGGACSRQVPEDGGLRHTRPQRPRHSRLQQQVRQLIRFSVASVPWNSKAGKARAVMTPSYHLDIINCKLLACSSSPACTPPATPSGAHQQARQSMSCFSSDSDSRRKRL